VAALVFQQLYRFKKEFQRLDEEQDTTDELAKSLYRLVVLIILVTILGIAAIILPYLKL
jgi:hypothetical protein